MSGTEAEHSGLRALLWEGVCSARPVNIVLMQALTESATPACLDQALEHVERELAGQAEAEAMRRLQAVKALWRSHPQAWTLVHDVLTAADHQTPAPDGAAGSVAHWAGTFDRLARLAPDAGVALYALGDADLLARATADVVDRLTEWQLLGSHRDAVEIGCGNGRFIGALAPLLRHVAGVDISAAMIEEARRKWGHLPNVRLDQTTGRDLGLLAGRSADLVLAVDVFPYLVIQGGGLAAVHLAEAARILRPGGSLLVLNYSYRGDVAKDQAELTEMSEPLGFRLRRAATDDFRYWDGATFWFDKA